MGHLDSGERVLRARIARWVLATYRRSPARTKTAFCAWLDVDKSVLTNFEKAEERRELESTTASVDLLYKLLIVTGANINRVLRDDITMGDEEDMEPRLRNAWDDYQRDVARKNAAG